MTEAHAALDAMIAAQHRHYLDQCEKHHARLVALGDRTFPDDEVAQMAHRARAESERQLHEARQRAQASTAAAHRSTRVVALAAGHRAPAAIVAPRTQARPRGAGRPRAQVSRSSAAASGDSGSSDDGLDPPSPRLWHHLRWGKCNARLLRLLLRAEHREESP
jgi:hypothetical protein